MRVICLCGGETFIESVRVRGYWKTTIDGNGASIDTNLDHLKYEPSPATVVCEECGRRCLNPRKTTLPES